MKLNERERYFIINQGSREKFLRLKKIKKQYFRFNLIFKFLFSSILFPIRDFKISVSLISKLIVIQTYTCFLPFYV